MTARILIVDDSPSIHEDFRQILVAQKDRLPGDAERMNTLAQSLFDDEEQAPAAGCLGDPRLSLNNEVDHAYHGDEALLKIKASIEENQPYSLVFMDVRMPPGMDGIQTIQNVHKTWPDVDMDFAICTAFSDYTWEEMVGLLDFPDRVYFIRKPFDRVAILQLVLALFESRSLRNERNQALEALSSELKTSAKSLEKYKLLFDQSRDGFYHHDLDTGEKRFNPMMLKMWGYDPNLPAEAHEFMKKFKLFYEFYFGSAERPKAQTVGFPIVQKYNQVRWVSFTLQVIRDKGGPLRVLDIKALDITDQKLRERSKLEAEVAKAKAKAKTELLNHMSHELRTPINGILGMCELIKDTAPTEKQSEYIHCIDRSTTHLLCMINDILDHAKCESGNMTIEYIPFDLYQLIDDVSVLFLKKIRDNNVELYVEINPQVPRHIEGDPTRVSQVLINFLSNAFKFTQKGHVTLKINLCQHNQLRFDVEDTGIGIADDKLESIFNRYAQAEISTARKYGGTGLGLAISRDLAELMGGEVRVTSELGKGSTFSCTIALKIDSQDQNVVQEPKPQSAPTTTASGQLILVSTGKNGDLIAQYFNQFGIEHLIINNTKWSDEPSQSPKNDDNQSLMLDLSQDREHILSLADQLVKQYTFRNIIIFGAEKVCADELQKRISHNYSIERPITPLKALRLRDVISPSDHETAIPETKKSTSFNGQEVLIVDDNTVNVTVVERMLEKLGVVISVAKNGQEAIELVQQREKPFDLVLMDCEMPVLDGYDASQSIRALDKPWARQMPIIALSANSAEKSAALAVQAGMNSFITKPVRRAALEEILLRWTVPLQSQ